ncbi:TORTIFOLIA1-like protein 4 [Citrus sinensis]|uniref:TORTIFOLIA1-like protein 4 isoform X2 n=1 Tax=Citrus sinensis TaxID=2711 RepID=UPI0003D70462|nr:TORTIFOLIA1-like protein 4 isoform X2 [Citrus sinensis]KAH9709207.1 TORTIFOLIA1-like protein 4 [Citrus sinensis]
MSPQKRSSSASPPPSTNDLKQRVITCLNKLADRDTLPVATAELESIARTLTQDSFSSFLNCLQTTDSSSKSPVRKQCVNLLTLLSRSHGDSLSPHLSKMISTVSCRLRDPDSSVRSACVAATTAMSLNITKPSFSVLSKPLIELILVEQDVNSQVGGAMCLAAAIDAAPNPEVEQLRKLLPRLGKAVRIEGFKAKAAVLGVIGSVVRVGGARSKGVLDWLVPCLVEFLCCDDWATRKAAAEVLGKVAVFDKDLATEYKRSCLAALETRRFDKVKIVRETMNRSLEMWKEVPGVCEEVSSPSPSKSFSIDNGSSGCFPSITKSSQNVGLRTPQPKKMVPTSRSPASDSSYGTTSKTEISFKSNNRKSGASILCKSADGKPSDWKVEIAVPRTPSSIGTCEVHNRTSDSKDAKLGEVENNVNCQPEKKMVIYSKIRDDKMYKCGGFKSGSRVVPYSDDEKSDFVPHNGIDEDFDYPKDPEDLSLIREQLLQIENQQSSLFDLLQRFIGSSQSGMNSLETRVHGLEMALDEISYDLALSNGRILNNNAAENTCCKLPGAEFLSSKFWRRAEDVRDLRGNSGFHQYRKVKNLNEDVERLQLCNAGRLDGASSPAACVAPAVINSRLSA